MSVAADRDGAAASPLSKRCAPREVGRSDCVTAAQQLAKTAPRLNNRNLESIRQQCAEKLQRRLQNPELRAEKALLFTLHHASESKAIVPDQAGQVVQQQLHPTSTTQSYASGGISPLRERRLERALKRAASPMQQGRVPELPLYKSQQGVTDFVRSKSAPHSRPVGNATSKANATGTRFPNKAVNEGMQGKGRDISAAKTRTRVPVAVARTAAMASAGVTTGAGSAQERASSAGEHKPVCGVSPRTPGRTTRPARARGGTQTSTRLPVSAVAAQRVNIPQAQIVATASVHQCLIADSDSWQTSPTSHQAVKDCIFCDPPSEEKVELPHAKDEVDHLPDALPATMRLAWEAFSDGADDGKGTDSATTPESLPHQAFNISDTPQGDFGPGGATGPHPLNTQRFTPGRTRQLKDVARSLETAALALHQVIGHSADVKGFGQAVTAFKENLNLSIGSSVNGPITDLKELKGCDLASKLLKAAASPENMESDSQVMPADPKLACKNNLSMPNASGSLQELASENATLRDALTTTTRRLAELQGEKEGFLSEGVFDLVNTLCRSAPFSSESMGGA